MEPLGHGEAIPGDEDTVSPSCSNSKLSKELENTALQNSLHSRRSEGTSNKSNDRRAAGEELQTSTNESWTGVEVDMDQEDRKVPEEERSLTDHLNKRLLASFLQKLNERDCSLPGIQRLDCAVAGEEDSNRAMEEW